MIKNASELLAAFMAAERKEAEAIPMAHMPTLGAAYEAIVRSGIDRNFVLPPNLDLRVVGGFIDGLPNQFDCMLVRGEGRPYARTGLYFYPIDQVLCVLEVKKTMSRAALVDGIGHLADVQRHFMKRFEERHEAGEVQDVESARLSFSQMTGRAAPLLRELDQVSFEDQLLFGVLVRQMYAPTTVLLGFDGYGTERGLREALLDLIESDAGTSSNLVPDLLPSLISVGELSLVKCGGQPYIAWDEDTGWVAIASTRHNAALVLLEFLWTKIGRFCNVQMPFGPQVEVETLDKVLVANGTFNNGKAGWLFKATSRTEIQLSLRPAAVPWEPQRLTRGAVTVTDLMCFRGGAIDLDQDLRDYLKDKYEEDLEQIAAALVRTSAFRLLGRQLHVNPPVAFVATFPDKTGIAGTDRQTLEFWCLANGMDATFMTLLFVA